MTATVMSETARDRLIVALDVPDAGAALSLIERLDGRCAWVKVGLELFVASGPSVVERLAAQGLQVFLDLKLHDIPNTVAASVRAVSGLGASLLTVHAGGGPAMLLAAQEAASARAGAPALLGVTTLTSMDSAQLAAVGVERSVEAQVLGLAQLAQAAGLRGLVCSALECAMLRTQLPAEKSPLLVVPGIRPAGAALGDQSRVATPAEALRNGASMLVIGRPITQATDPAAAAEAVLREMDAALSGRE